MKTTAIAVAAAIAGFGGTAPAVAQTNSLPADVAALQDSAGSVTEMRAASLESGVLSRLSGQRLVSDPDFWVFDIVDDEGDAYMDPELRGAGLAVAKGEEDNLDLAAITDSYTYGSDEFGFLLDTDADGESDFGALVNTFLDVDGVVRVPLFKFVNGSATATDRTVLIGRSADGYVARIQDWRGAGMTRVSYTLFLDDGVDTDFAPNRYASPIPLGALVPSGGGNPVPSDGPIQSADPVRKSKPQTSVAAKSVRRASRLRVDVNPDRGDVDWIFQVEKKKRGRWITLTKKYRTRGGSDVAIVDLSRGLYRAKVMPQHGHQGSTSWAVTLKR